MDRNTTRSRIPAALFFLLSAVLIALLASGLVLPVSAAASASLSGTSSLRAGDTLTVTLRLNAPGTVAANGTVSFDASKLTFKSFDVPLSGWGANVNEVKSGTLTFVAESSTLTPITKESKLLTLSFRVKSSLSPGTTVKVKADSLNYFADGKESSLSVSAYSATLLAPKSGNAELSSLEIRQTSFTPEFSPDVTEYAAASVPFAVSTLTLDMKTADKNAKTEVSGASLSVGENKVKITVTAEDGTVKVYTVSVEREQDPDYVPSSDAALSSVTLSEGRLSPAFTPERWEYVIYVPAEVVDLTVGGTPRDPKAQGGERVTAILNDGDNVLTYFNRAEDGTEMGYVFHIVRMPLYDGHLPEIVPWTEPVETEPPETEPVETEPPETEPPATEPPVTDAPETAAPATEAPETEGAEPRTLSERLDTFTLLAVGISGCVFLGIGIAVGALAMKGKKVGLEEIRKK